ncbi:MAG: hypothetical protein QOE76_706 [Frankiales bacterium]|jgi:hypothetical protein|nr:hypothetical protein [Frankiales bacterium]
MTEPPSWSAPGDPPPERPDPPGYGAAPPPPSPQYGAPPAPGQQPLYGAPPPGYGPPPGWGQPQYGAPQYGAPPPPYGYQPYAAAAPKPGIIPLRPLSVSEILDGAFTTIRRHPKATLGVSAVVACVQQALSVAVQALTGSLSSGGGGFSLTGFHVSSSDTATGGDVARSLVGSFGVTLINLVLSAVLTGVLCLVVSDSVLGQPSSAGSAWRRVKPLAWRVLGASLLVGFCQIAGLILCVLPGMFLWGAWALVIPALVLERIGVRAAIRRSYRLVTPTFWRVFGIRLLGKLIATAVAAPFVAITLVTGASDIFSQLSSNSSTQTVHLSATTVIVAAIVSVIVTTLTAPFLAGMVTLLYIDRRIRAEALDVQLQQAAANPVASVVAPPPAFG